MSIPQKQIDVLISIAPEMATLPSATIDTFIELGQAQTQLACKNQTINYLAVAYIAAHSYTLSQRAGNGGAVNSLKEGDLQISYEKSNNSFPFAATSYGQEYMRLVRTYSVGVRNIFTKSSSCL